METYTITLTEKEMGMLITATNDLHHKYKRPEMTEAARKGAQDYADLCAKLYYKMMEQEMEKQCTKRR